MFANFMDLLMIQQKTSSSVKHLNMLQTQNEKYQKLFFFVFLNSLQMIYSFNYCSFLKERSTHFNADSTVTTVKIAEIISGIKKEERRRKLVV